MGHRRDRERHRDAALKRLFGERIEAIPASLAKSMTHLLGGAGDSNRHQRAGAIDQILPRRSIKSARSGGAWIRFRMRRAGVGALCSIEFVGFGGTNAALMSWWTGK